MKQEFSYGIIPLRLVENQYLVLLICHHAGHWSFPKGHAEINEQPKQTAERELFEETGLKVKQYLTEKIFREIYFFTKENALIKKEVGYFAVLVEDGPVKIQDEEIKAFKWVSLEESMTALTFSESKKIIESLKDLSLIQGVK